MGKLKACFQIAILIGGFFFFKTPICKAKLFFALLFSFATTLFNRFYYMLKLCFKNNYKVHRSKYKNVQQFAEQ